MVVIDEILQQISLSEKASQMIEYKPLDKLI